MRTATVLAALAALAIAVVQPAGARKEAARSEALATRLQLVRLLDRIESHRDETWRWQRLMLQTPTRYSASAA